MFLSLVCFHWGYHCALCIHFESKTKCSTTRPMQPLLLLHFCTVHLCPSSVPLTSAPLHIFTSSLFKSSHLQICTSSPHLHHSFTSSHLQIFTCTCACTCTCTCALPPSSSSTPTAYPPTPTATYSLQLLLPHHIFTTASHLHIFKSSLAPAPAHALCLPFLLQHPLLLILLLSSYCYLQPTVAPTTPTAPNPPPSTAAPAY